MLQHFLKIFAFLWIWNKILRFKSFNHFVINVFLVDEIINLYFRKYMGLFTFCLFIYLEVNSASETVVKTRFEEKSEETEDI